MSLRVLQIVLIIVASCLTLGCKDQRGSLPAQEYVAKVGDQIITSERFLDALLQRGGESREVFDDHANRLAVLDELLRTELIVAHARKKGFIERPDIADSIKKLVATRYLEEILGATGVIEDVSREEALAFYDRHTELFRTPELARIAVIYLSVPERATDESRFVAKQRAVEIREAALKQNNEFRHFGELAALHSEDQATRYKGGDAGWITRTALESRWPEPALDIIFAMREAGETSPVIETDRGLYVFRLMDYQSSSRLPFDVVERNVAHQIVRERRERLVEDMVAESRRAVRVSIRDDVVRSIIVPPLKASERQTAPPALPNG
ncbi:MAG TPA: peptidylprolyl isomerase [Kiritimatiellia bacterium]|nr:peptidylprolyl isomerase [Kiritimatiellia bacterium]